MATGFPIVTKGKQSWLQSHDWQLGAIITVTVALFLVLLIPIISTLRLSLAYHSFIDDLSESALYGRGHGTTVVTLEGVGYRTKADWVSRVLECISDAGMGKPSDAEPQGGFLISFGDGSSLSMSKAEIGETSSQSDVGVLVRYTRADGSVYAYDTDRMTYEALCDYMHLPS